MMFLSSIKQTAEHEGNENGGIIPSHRDLKKKYPQVDFFQSAVNRSYSLHILLKQVKGWNLKVARKYSKGELLTAVSNIADKLIEERGAGMVISC